MRFFSENGIILTAVILFTGVASANKAEEVITPDLPTNNKAYTATGSTDLKTAKMLVNLLRNPHLKVQAKVNFPQTSSDPSYTAHGKTDLKTATMLINLLRNPHLKVKAELHSSNTKSSNDMYYSISGSTDKQTIKKLRALLQNNKQIQISVQKSNKRSKNVAYTTNTRKQPQPQAQQYLYKNYSAIVAQGMPFYHYGRPPVFIQGKTLWYPVIVAAPPSNVEVQKISSPPSE